MKNVLQKIIFCLALSFTFGCSSDDNTTEKNELIFEFDKEQFEKNREAWLSNDFQNYNYFEYQMSSSTGPLEYQIEVRGGIAKNVSEPDVKSKSISQIYEEIQKNVDFYTSPDYKSEGKEHYSLYVRYDSEFHYPTYYSLTLYNAPPGGGGFSKEFSEFELIE